MYSSKCCNSVLQRNFEMLGVWVCGMVTHTQARVRARYTQQTGNSQHSEQQSERPACTISRQAQQEQKERRCLAAVGSFLQYRMRDVGQDKPAFNTTASSAKAETCRTTPWLTAQQIIPAPHPGGL